VAFKRREEPSIEEERQALRAQHAALEDLKRQLAERVEAVRARELELHHVLAEARPAEAVAPPPLRPRARPAADEDDTDEHALAAKRREDELAARERAVAERETRALEQERELERRAQALAGSTAAAAREPGLESSSQQATAVVPVAAASAAEAEERLERIEARLAELREAERMFLRTRDELAVRSEAVAARERLVAQKERELDEREDASPWATPELSEVEARLRRLEQQQVQPAAEQAAGFTGGLRKLQQGARKPPRSV
jgi:hypothetical protein